MKELILILSYPIAWGIYKLKLTDLFSLKIHRILLASFVSASAILVFSPVSFYGRNIDFIILLGTLLLVFTYGLRSIKEGAMTAKAIVLAGQAVFLAVPFFILLMMTNPLYYAYTLDMEGWEPKGVTRLKKNRLEHYCRNSNFSYPGNHIIKIQKDLIPYMLEWQVAKVNTGKFYSSDLPDFKIISTTYKEDGSSESRELNETIYMMTDSSLVKKTFNLNTQKFIVESEFRY